VPRFEAVATVERAGPTAEGARYTVQATARLAAIDGVRYAVKSLAASCVTQAPDGVFSDGFEPAPPGTTP